VQTRRYWNVVDVNCCYPRQWYQYRMESTNRSLLYIYMLLLYAHWNSPCMCTVYACNNNVYITLLQSEEWAAVRIQSVWRGYLVRPRPLRPFRKQVFRSDATTDATAARDQRLIADLQKVSSSGCCIGTTCGCCVWSRKLRHHYCTARHWHWHCYYNTATACCS
jgi:IQ calmodulin-binding motif